MNKKNQTALVTAKFKDDEIVEVTLEKPSTYWYRWAILILIFTLATWFIYNKYFNIPKIKEKLEQRITKPIDYKKEALKLLERARRLFSENREKDAYGKAAQAIRFFYSYKIGSKIQITNSDLINLLKKNKIPYDKTQKCLNLCGLVEFAKYQANKKDFDKIAELGEKIINK